MPRVRIQPDRLPARMNSVRLDVLDQAEKADRTHHDTAPYKAYNVGKGGGEIKKLIPRQQFKSDPGLDRQPHHRQRKHSARDPQGLFWQVLWRLTNLTARRKRLSKQAKGRSA